MVLISLKDYQEPNSDPPEKRITLSRDETDGIIGIGSLFQSLGDFWLTPNVDEIQAPTPVLFNERTI